MKNLIKQQLVNLTDEQQLELLNIYASNESGDYYVYADLEELLEIYQYSLVEPSDLINFLRDFRDINPYSTEYVWEDDYGRFQQGTAKDALDEKWDLDLMVEFCLNNPYEVEDLIEIPEEEEDEE